ncbi:ABC transporter substrate-binding protein [Marinobacter sp. VGCF2001]|uniref:ABC transporter substrate-binding protein n=1 Tax=Marinobacter sp. VGCF2001 TaxID=3417189 RepID=UPI003CF0B5BC
MNSVIVALFLVAVALFVHPATASAQEAARALAYVVGSGNSALDNHVTGLLENQLAGKVTLKPVAEPALAALGDSPVITIGPVAFSKVRQQNRALPVLALLVEKQFIDDYAARSPGMVTAVYYDVPLLRQALTGQAILPQATRVALLATTESAALYEPLLEQLADYDLEARVFIADTEDQLVPSLIRALDFGDFLLAGPDDDIYNPRNIKHILLTAYRRNKILVGPNQAYVKAGALASSYAPFTAMAVRAGNYLFEYLETGAFPAPAYPGEFRVEINRQVARSLNIPVPEREQIAQSVQTMINQHHQENGQ